MTKEEWRIRDFSFGIEKLCDESRNYIERLTLALFFIEKPPVFPLHGEKDRTSQEFKCNNSPVEKK